ncbi:NADPH:quinone reductase-like Zn-dependent oxidoreductase [Motilibacter rhizosphaerae]|uniref:NADPH:quinone reductase-like Zn-dependent oxidoreductase n=1 Tax=Motilibacter rhizosphaerae TaxID=598652 RepID=A0A4Q7NAT7_9ACTN|nr:NADP-dependent oxidoreductase [Motilibacter rhizosphaerae]RZS79001.1 NADPH:quinone reductase-like Zn-dependent oxidoreductase [Motilibacter rhizosphaerae]
MTRAVVATAYGDPDVLSVTDVQLDPPGPGEVLLEVRAAGINPVDWKTYSGGRSSDPAKLPLRLGFEAAGVVLALGPDVDTVAVGDEVIALRISGAYADQVVVPATALVPKPASLPWAEAAGLMLAGATAVHALTAVGLEAGETVLVHGGAGGVGLMLVQLAKLRGAAVVATASERNFPLLRRFGAEPVTYGDGLADRVRAAAPQGVDAAVDAVGTDEAVDVSLELVGDVQRIASIAAFGRGDTGIRLLGGGPGADPGTELRDAARPELARQAGAGDLVVVVDRAYALAEVAEAHRHSKDGHASGKVVLVP